ncbi:T9SS type A sorting domain-containing protein [Flavobacterium suncheonense]|uniref:T9SS type A sorting domain-containing protein n=1 Tax=Flavobacterium suncheonense TaxID=350894 RepID=UPI003FA3A592
MIRKITQLFKLQHLCFASILLSGGMSFAQTAAKNPVYNLKGDEVVAKRDLFAKHFLNPDGSYTAAIASGPIHYEKNGAFLNIDNTIRPFSSTSYTYANTENLLESYFGATAHTGIKNKTKEGEVLEFQNTTMYWEVAGQKAGEQQSTNAAIVIVDNKAYYNNLYGSINAEFVALNGKRKLNYIIPNAEALAAMPANATYLVFTEKVTIPTNWSYANTEEGLVIRNEKQENIYLYNKPYSFDANGKKLRSNNTEMAIAAEGNVLTIATKVKTSWLLNTNRVFPVTVDPTVTVYPDMANYNTGSVYSSDYYKLTADIGFGRDEDNGAVEDFLRGWAKFNTASVPDDAIVSNGVTINYYVYYASPDYSPAYGHELVFSQLNLNPVTASGSTLYNAIEQFGYGPFVTAAINSVGWKAHTITSAAIQNDIANGLVNNYFSIGFMPQGDFYEGELIAVDGWDYDKPYLTFTYTQPTMSSDSFNKLVSIYPNPTANTLTVATDLQIESIKIYSLVGQLICTNTHQNTIDISSLPKGIYLAEITLDNGKVISERVIKK